VPGPEPAGTSGPGRGARAVPAGSWLRWALAGLWLLDAGLQLQPAMFGPSFPSNVLYNSALMYQPPGLEGILFRIASIEAHHLVLLSALIAVVQVAIALGLLFEPLLRPALLLSICWATLVWLLGQGLGLMATGTAMIAFGAPGSAILYIVLAVVVWQESGQRARDGRAGLFTARWAWSGFWALGALLQLPWRYSAAAVLAYNLQTAAQLQPAHLSAFDYLLARTAYANGAVASLLLGSLELCLAVLVWPPLTRRWSIWLGLVATAAFWVLGQAMGGIFAGVATDPGTGPLVLLLGIYLLSASRRHGPAPGRAPQPALNSSSASPLLR
jgi:hypothetical protein